MTQISIWLCHPVWTQPSQQCVHDFSKVEIVHLHINIYIGHEVKSWHIYTIAVASFQTVTIFPHYKDNKVRRIFLSVVLGEYCLQYWYLITGLHYYIYWILLSYDYWEDVINNHQGGFASRWLHISLYMWKWKKVPW